MSHTGLASGRADDRRIDVVATVLTSVTALLGRVVIVGGCEWWLGEEVMEAAGEVALEAAQRVFGRLAFGFFADQVVPGGRVVFGAGHGDDVQRMVELAVAAAVEPVLGLLP